MWINILMALGLILAVPCISQADSGLLVSKETQTELHLRNAIIIPLTWPKEHKSFRVLVFTKSKEHRHESIPAGIAAIKELGKDFGFEVQTTENDKVFTSNNLKKFKAVIFLLTTGNVLNSEEEKAFEGYIHSGGGFVAIHSACGTQKDWPWYGRLLGALFNGHSKPQNARVRLRDDKSPSTAVLPHTWKRFDEWYNFKQLPQEVEVLADVDESTYKGGKMGKVHPIAWQHSFEGGRVWVTVMGHTKESYYDPLFLLHILGGIQFAAGLQDKSLSGQKQ